MSHPVNALFESMSGFTTTGSTVIGETSTDRHSHALLMWRQLTQWMGGMGIIVLLFAMFIGGSAGSTGGGIKVIRWVIVLKAARRELFTAAYPEAVRPIRLAGSVVEERAVRGILAFTMLYLVVFGFVAVAIALDAARVGMELTTLEAISASLATIGNIGPGFGLLGPFGSSLAFPSTSKLLMIFLMWLGRLEIIPVLALLSGSYWNR